MSTFTYDRDPPVGSSPPPPLLARADRDELARLAEVAADAALTAQENASTNAEVTSREAWHASLRMLAKRAETIDPDCMVLPDLEAPDGQPLDVLAEALRSWAREVRSLPVAADPPTPAARLHAAGVAIRNTQARYPGVLEMVMLDFDPINPRIEVAWRHDVGTTRRVAGQLALADCATAVEALGYHVAWGGRDMIAVSAKREVKP